MTLKTRVLTAENSDSSAQNYIMNIFYIENCYLKCDLTFTFNHLADTFIKSDLQMRTIEAIKPTKEQQCKRM